MAAAAATERIPTRERRPSVGVPLVDIQGSVGPAGITRPKHKRTFTGFGAQEIKSVEGMLLNDSGTQSLYEAARLGQLILGVRLRSAKTVKEPAKLTLLPGSVHSGTPARGMEEARGSGLQGQEHLRE
jgi:hypothetical protein